MEMKPNIEAKPPLLLISHGQKYEKQSFHNPSENRCDTTTIPILCNKYVVGSSYGWLVLMDLDTKYCYLWHPLSMEIIELPRLPRSSAFVSCVLSKPPTEPGCHILFNTEGSFVQAFCEIGDDEFVQQSLEEEESGDVKSLMAMASFNGNIYGFVGYGDRFVTIHFVGKTLEWRPILKAGQPWHVHIPSRPWARSERDYLIPCDGELFLVHKMHPAYYIRYYCDFKIFRVDTSRMELVELENIGQRAIFISRVGEAFCCSSKGIKPNSIYYTLGNIEGRNLYIYDLGNRSTTALRPCLAARHSGSMSFWVEPKFSIQ